jgi:PPM family protein phosphatase
VSESASESLQVTAAAATHVGHVRDNNEDALHVGTGFHAVADGMGGHAAGEVASALAIAAIADLDDAGVEGSAEEAGRVLAEAVREVNRAVHRDAETTSAHAGMGTTLTAAAVREEQLVLAHVGDSRAYLVRDGAATQLTVDHAIGPYTLTRVIGPDPEVEVDAVGPLPLRAGDVVVLCSDGLTAVVATEELPALVADADAQQAADALVAATLERGAPDNVAVVVLLLHR